MGARLLQSSNRFTAYSIYPIELKHCRMILDFSLHDVSGTDFSIFLPGALRGAPLEIVKSIRRLVFIRLC